MAYSAAADLLNLLGDAIYAELTAETGTAPDSARALAVLEKVSRLMDSYLGRYTVPITAAGAIALLDPHCLNMGKYMLIGRRLAEKYDPAAENLYNKAIEWLEKVGKRELDLPGATPAVTLTTTTGSGGWTSNDPVYTSTEFRRI